MEKIINYNDKIHRMGRISGSIVLFLIVLAPASVCIYFNIFPPIAGLLKGTAMVCIIYIPICIAEFATYTPMLGSNASYLVFVTGNLTNLKIPCALMAMDNADVKPQSDEGEVIAAIAVAVSSIVTIIIVFIGMLLVVPLRPLLNSPELKPAFDNILPALFGALGVYWIQKQWKLAIVPIIIVILIYLIFNLPSGVEGVLIPIMGVISVISARIMYKKGFVKDID
ncbi:MAG: hypothetical protein N4A68_03140 [Maledivibacter sp.]|nr:hypothetical protein [Maledivibacter sp.]